VDLTKFGRKWTPLILRNVCHGSTRSSAIGDGDGGEGRARQEHRGSDATHGKNIEVATRKHAKDS